MIKIHSQILPTGSNVFVSQARSWFVGQPTFMLCRSILFKQNIKTLKRPREIELTDTYFKITHFKLLSPIPQGSDDDIPFFNLSRWEMSGETWAVTAHFNWPITVAYILYRVKTTTGINWLGTTGSKSMMCVIPMAIQIHWICNQRQRWELKDPHHIKNHLNRNEFKSLSFNIWFDKAINNKLKG